MTGDLQFLVKGGVVMVPLFVCAVIAVAVMIDRAMALGLTIRDNRTLVAEVDGLLRERRYADALTLCERTGGRVAALLASGLRSRTLDHVAIERRMEEFALRQMPVLQERLSTLDTIVTLAPLLGLLGTITGMIRAFHIVGGAVNSPVAITSGVSEALIATSVGLTIAIIALPAYNYLTERVQDNIAEMEWRATQLLNMVADTRPTGGSRR